MISLEATPHKVDWLALWSHLPLRAEDFVSFLPTQTRLIQLDNQRDRLQSYIANSIENDEYPWATSFINACYDARYMPIDQSLPDVNERVLSSLKTQWKLTEIFLYGGVFRKGQKLPKLNPCELARVILAQEEAVLEVIELERNFTALNLRLQEIYLSILAVKSTNEILNLRNGFPFILKDFPPDVVGFIEELKTKRDEIFIQNTDSSREEFLEYILASSELIDGENDELIAEVRDLLDEVKIWLQWSENTASVE